jgi:hypothetical protein
MSPQTQYGHTLFLDGFQAGSSAKCLNRLHFSKKASERAPFDEAWLQRLIMVHPSVLPVDQIEPAFSPLVPICIELPVGPGAMDNLFVTPAGDLALVECKLWRNPEARREVVAQIIDYAKDMATWTYEKLQEAINRTKPLNGSDDNTSRRLYGLVSAEGEIDEASFHDAVSRNLKRGRFLLLIVGDGIREGAEGLAEFLQQYAGFHFTLALVELALFEVSPEHYIAQPRILARTTNIERGIVTLDEGRIIIKPPSIGTSATATTMRRSTITREHYFEQVEKEFSGISQKLNAFLDDLAALDVSPEFGTDCLILRWRPDDGRSWNLATISSHGQVLTENLGQQAKIAALLEEHKRYLSSLAALVPGALVKETTKETAWYVALGGKVITIDSLVADPERRDGWIAAIETFQKAAMQQ